MKTSWQNVKISYLGSIKTGKTPKTFISDNYGGKILFLTPSDDMEVKYIRNTGKKLTQKGMEEVKNCLLPKDAVCVSCIGSDLGKVVMTTEPTVTNQQINSIVVNKEICDANFCYYRMIMLGKVLNYHGKISTAVPIVNKTTFSNYEILLPPMSEQKKIAKILSVLDDKIELNNKINQNLESQAQTLFNKYFSNIFSGEKCIGNYISPKRGKNLLSKDAVIGDVPVIAGGLQPATYHNVANTVAPVITISASGANAGFVNLWHVPVWSSDSSFIDSSITPFVYFWYVMLKLRQNEIFDAQTGSAQPHIYPQHIERIPLSELDIEKVKEYNEIISSLFEKIGYNIKENNTLSKLRDTLLPKLMSGDIEVSNEDISEVIFTDKLLLSND